MPYVGVEGKRDVLMVSCGGEGDLRQGVVVLGTGKRGVKHQHVALCGEHKTQGGEAQRMV